MTLDRIGLNDKAFITKVEGEDLMKRRLLDLGFIPGREVECVLVSFAQDPKAYQVNGNVIALRGVDAKKIEVKYAAD